MSRSLPWKRPPAHDKWMYWDSTSASSPAGHCFVTEPLAAGVPPQDVQMPPATPTSGPPAVTTAPGTTLDRHPIYVLSSNGFFNRMKNGRDLPSRKDMHGLTYGGGVVLAAILDWLT